MAKAAYEQKKIALNKLVESEENVRIETPSAKAIEQLIASISAVGLLQPLIVKETSEKTFEVVDGACRHLALLALAERGDIKPGSQVPCAIAPQSADATKISLIANFARLEMHPVDQMKAFLKLKESGQTEESIAQDFGLSVKQVRQRLKLARVHDEILEAYKAREVSLDDVQAFAVTDDQDRQIEFFKNGSWFNSYQIRAAMTREAYPGHHYLVRFVGLDTYEAAGGTVVRDLFSDEDDCYLEDVPLVQRLAREKLEEMSAEYRNDGWSWTEVNLGRDYTLYNQCEKIKPEGVELSEADSVEMAEIEAQIEELSYNGNLDAEEYETLMDLEGRREVLISKGQRYTNEDKARAGVFIILDYKGIPEIFKGLVKPAEEVVEEDAAGDTDAACDREGTAEDDSGVETAEETKNSVLDGKITYSQSLLDDLRIQRGKAMQAAIAQDHQMAYDVLLYSMAAPLLTKSYCSNPLSISPTATGRKLTEIEQEANSSWVVLQEIESSFGIKWDAYSDRENFDAIAALPAEEKEKLLSYCVALTFKDQLTTNAGRENVLEHVAKKSSMRIRDYWWPTPEAFTQRLKKADLLKIGYEIAGEQWASGRTNLKKGELAKSVANLFEPDNATLTPEQRAKAAEWLPDVMAVEPLEEPEAEVSDEVPAFLEEILEEDPSETSEAEDDQASDMAVAAE